MIKREPALDRWKRVLGPELLAGNRVEALVRGQATFRAMQRAVETATRQGHYIYLLGWSFSRRLPLVPETRLTGGENRDNGTMLEFMAKAVGRGAQVRVMLNMRTLEVVDNAWAVRDLNELGRNSSFDVAAILDGHAVSKAVETELIEVNPIESPVPQVHPKLHFASHHQKILLVRGEKGLIGFCGGVDIFQDRVLELGGGTPHHDVHCQVEGPAAHLLADVFVQRWHAHPEHTEIDKVKGRLMGLADRSARNRPRKGDQHVKVARTANFVVGEPVGSDCQGEHSVRALMLELIRNAKYFVYVEDQYLAHEEAAEALKRRLPELQHVTVVTPHPSIEPIFHPRRVKFIETLKSAPNATGKVRAFHAVSDSSGALGPFSYVHSKTWIIDDEVAVIGSANCNNRGWSYDSEVAAAIVDRDPEAPGTSFAQKLRMKLWALHLGVSPLDVVNGWGPNITELWSKRPVESREARVRPYDEKFQTGVINREVVSPRGLIDPVGDFPSCSRQALVKQSIVPHD